MNEELRLYECPICLEIIKSPIFQCHSGHILCSTCIEVVKICPQCREQMPEKRTRNLMLEEMILNMMVDCRNKDKGCKVKIKQKNSIEHLLDCLYQALPYCLSLGLKCKHRYTRNQLVQHLLWEHKDVSGLLSETALILEQELSVGSENNNIFWSPHFLTTSDQNNIFFITSQLKQPNMIWRVKYSGSSQIAAKFRAKIQLLNQNDVEGSTLIWKGKPLSINSSKQETTLVVPSFLLKQYSENTPSRFKWRVRILVGEMNKELPENPRDVKTLQSKILSNKPSSSTLIASNLEDNLGLSITDVINPEKVCLGASEASSQSEPLNITSVKPAETLSSSPKVRDTLPLLSVAPPPKIRDSKPLHPPPPLNVPFNPTPEPSTRSHFIPKLELVSSGQDWIKLKWKPSSIKYQEYRVQLASPNEPQFIEVYKGLKISNTLKNLQEDTSYKLRISAGDGPYSKEYTFKTKKPPPPQITLRINEKGGRIRFEWDNIELENVAYELQLAKRSKNLDFMNVFEGENCNYEMAKNKLNEGVHLARVSVKTCDKDGKLVVFYSPHVSYNIIHKPSALYTLFKKIVKFFGTPLQWFNWVGKIALIIVAAMILIIAYLISSFIYDATNDPTSEFISGLVWEDLEHDFEGDGFSAKLYQIRLG